MSTKSYSELISYSTFLDRYKYLEIGGLIGERTFGGNRYLNQKLYTSKEWRKFRRDIILRDEGRDLGVPGYELTWKICVHHINPLTEQDLIEVSNNIFDPENVICVSYNTHEAIHYGNKDLLILSSVVKRSKNDTCPWKGGTCQPRLL